jgi:DNA-directed RNA polymerase beta subunit
MLDVYIGREDADDRDFEGHKSVQMSAGVLSIMFRQQFAAMMKLLRNRVYDRYKKGKHLDIGALLSDTLTRDVLKAFSEGEVTVQKDASNAGTSVIQIAQQVNPLGIQTHIQRVSTALPRDGKYKELRGVDATQLFVFCPTETPEGHGCGLLQNLATFARVRVGTPLKFVEYAVLSLKSTKKLKKGHDLIRPFTNFADMTKTSTYVFVNSDPIGVTDDAEAFIAAARNARRSKILPFDCSIVKAEHGICISSDMGTVVFPLIHIEQLHLFPEAIEASKNGSEELWTAMCRLNMIEYVDAYELLEYRVALTPEEYHRSLQKKDTFKFSHLAVHPSGMLGLSASSVPWPNHDQAPRVAYQAGMVKQAISTPAANLRNRMDLGYAYELWYPQTPMADTAIARASGMNDWPMGENLMIAIAPHGGWSQEDSIIRNKASVDRGSGRITVYRVFKAVCRKRGPGDIECFEHPMWRGKDNSGPKCSGLRGSVNYNNIGFDGLPEEGTPMKNGDVIIGRVSNSSEMIGNDVKATRCDRSVILTCEPSETYYVDKILLTTTKEGSRSARIRLRTMRIPQEGDKISSRHGQKGTIGVLLPEEDMPYVMSGNNEGMRPDAIINLHR